MRITFVDQQLIDSGYAASPFLTKADSSCYQLTVKSGEAALVFSILFFIMTKTWKNIVDAFDRLRELPDFSWWKGWINNKVIILASRKNSNISS